MAETIKRDYRKMMSMFQNTAPESQTTTAGFDNDGLSELSISMLRHFPNHPFTLYSGERFDDLTASIKEHGVLEPVLVRQLDNGGYQILSGHNRCECARAAGFKTVPCIVLSGLSDDDALMIVLDSNTKQRGITEMKISEQAHIYALDVTVNKRQGKRSDLVKNIEENLKILSNDADSETSSHSEKKLTTMDMIGEKYGISRATIARLLRIDTLIYEMKCRIDDEEFGILAGVELSYLTEDEQEITDDVMREYEYTLDVKKAAQLRELSKNKRLNKVTVVDVLAGTYNKPKKTAGNTLKAFTLKPKFLSKYYSPHTTQSYIAEDIETGLDVWQELKRIYPQLSAGEIKLKIKENAEARGGEDE